MSSDYFDSSSYQLVAGTRARASGVNTALDALDTGLALLPSEANIKRGLINYAEDSGAADAYVVTLTYAPAAYTDGMQVVFKASAANTGECTINVNALGAKSIKRQDGSSPIAGDIVADKIVEIRYNSTSGQFELQGSIGADAGSGTMSSQNASSVSITGGAISGTTISGATVSGSSLATSSFDGSITGGTMADVAITDGTMDGTEFRTGTIDAPVEISHLSGHMCRSKFGYVDGDTITVGGGVYDVNGTLAKITSELTTVAHGETGADWVYLYIDYSTIPTTGVLEQDDLIWSTTEPTWSHSLMGWYNGNDRCIFAVYVDGGDDIIEFTHNRDYVGYSDQINVEGATNYTTSFTAMGSAFIVPSFVTIANAMFFLDAAGETVATTFTYRPTGSSATTGTQIGATDEDSAEWAYAYKNVILGTGKKIDLKQNDVTPTIATYEDGWYLPEGI